MGSSPKQVVIGKTKWSCYVSFKYGCSRVGTFVKGLDAPTENEVYNALYDMYGRYAEVELIEITSKTPYTE